jgi:hypothetical protein
MMDGFGLAKTGGRAHWVPVILRGYLVSEFYHEGLRQARYERVCLFHADAGFGSGRRYQPLGGTGRRAHLSY